MEKTQFEIISEGWTSNFSEGKSNIGSKLKRTPFSLESVISNEKGLMQSFSMDSILLEGEHSPGLSKEIL